MTKALTYIEIDIPFCANTYGVLPCTASLTSSPPTGTRKCFNTPNTCQDRANYIDAPVTLRFASDVGFLPQDIDVIPSVTGITYTPSQVSLGNDLGTRASLAVKFRDHPWPDTYAGFDKYLSERPYNPMVQGSFWGKFRARQPFLRGRSMRLIRGFLGQTLAEMETRHFVIDSFTHNAADGTYTITAKDVLKLADDDRSQAPKVSQGFLVADITDTDTVATLSPSGIGNEEYNGHGYVAMGGKEIAAYQRDATVGNDANTHLLLHMEGANGGTVFTDSASSPKTVSVSGSVVTTTGAKQWGASAALFSGGQLFLSDHADFTPAADFTFDMWVRWNNLTGTQTLFLHATDANNRYFLQSSSAGALTFSVVSAGVTIVTMSTANGVIVAAGAGFYHIAVMRTGNVWVITVDGVQKATTTDSDAIPNFTSFFRLGIDQAGANAFAGTMDEFRLSHVARFTVPFTPPESAYQTSSDILTLVRGQLNTTAISHKAQDRVQLVLQYDAQDVADILYDLLVNYASVPSSYIPLSTWKDETANFLARVFTATIAEATGVNKLIGELIEDAALSIWWDDVAQQIRLRVLRPISTDATIIDEDVYLADTFASKEQPNTRVSQVWRYFAKRNALEPQDNDDNYRSVAATVDLQAETDYGSSAIHKIYSRWIPFGGRSIADKANTLYLSRFRDPPRLFTFSMMRSDDFITPELGQGYQVGGMGLQDDTGSPVVAPVQITRLNPGDAKFDVEAQELLITGGVDLTNRIIVIDSNTSIVKLKELHDTLYPVATAADVVAGVNLKVYIDAGVIVSGTRAFDVQTGWPTGFPITVIVNGKLQGAAGNGGSGANNGQAGGTALYTRFPITLEYTGSIWGGGGGGGGGAIRFNGSSGVLYCGCGGGGAAGIPRSNIVVDGVNIGNGGPGAICNGVRAPNGQSGTDTTGGLGGNNGSAGNPGGQGGTPGVAGQNGFNTSAGPTLVAGPGTGGAAGNSIDGISFVTVTVSSGTTLGPQIN